MTFPKKKLGIIQNASSLMRMRLLIFYLGKLRTENAIERKGD